MIHAQLCAQVDVLVWVGDWCYLRGDIVASWPQTAPDVRMGICAGSRWSSGEISYDIVRQFEEPDASPYKYVFSRAPLASPPCQGEASCKEPCPEEELWLRCVPFRAPYPSNPARGQCP